MKKRTVSQSHTDTEVYTGALTDKSELCCSVFEVLGKLFADSACVVSRVALDRGVDLQTAVGVVGVAGLADDGGSVMQPGEGDRDAGGERAVEADTSADCSRNILRYHLEHWVGRRGKERESSRNETTERKKLTYILTRS